MCQYIGKKTSNYISNMNIFYLLICSLLNFIQFNSGATYTCDPNISCGCSIVSTTISTRIVGGEAAPNHAWSWTVSLQKDQKHRCNAVLISNQYALTAAHCVNNGILPSQLRIVAGTNYLDDTSNDVQIRQINAFSIHPLYNSKKTTYDIAVLYFSSLNLSSNSTIRLICLPTLNINPFSIGSDVTTVGWGVTSYGSQTPSTYLQQVTVEIFSPTSNNCIQGEIADKNLQICAGTIDGGKGKIISSFYIDRNHSLFFLLL